MRSGAGLGADSQLWGEVEQVTSSGCCSWLWLGGTVEPSRLPKPSFSVGWVVVWEGCSGNTATALWQGLVSEKALHCPVRQGSLPSY